MASSFTMVAAAPGAALAAATGGYAVTADIPVKGLPERIALDPAAGAAYVTQFNSNSVAVLSEATHKITATIPVGTHPEGVAADPKAGTVYVANSDDDTVSVINVATNKVVATIGVGNGPFGVATDPAAGTVYVTNVFDRSVSVIDVATNKVTATVIVGADPNVLTVDPVAGKVYVASFLQWGTVAVIDVAKNQVTTAYIPVGSFPTGIAADPVLGKVYVSDYTLGEISVIDVATDEVTSAITVGKEPAGIAVDPAAGVLYICNSGDGTVSVIDAATQKVVGTVPVTDPFAVDVDPVTGVAYGTHASDSVFVLQRPLTATGGLTLIAGAGAAAAGTVARFTDPAKLPASSYTAKVDWGDGTTSAGPVTSTGPGRYQVDGSHAYAHDGRYTITVTITQKSATGNTGTAVSRALIYATGLGGNFTIGANHSAVGGTATFWGNTWHSVNQVLLGSTPSNFRGWEDQASLPACGASWTTSPYIAGRPPAAPLPAYIPVIVTGGFHQAATGRVTGSTRHIVVVKTNSGYQPSPAYAGTGQVIATVC